VPGLLLTLLFALRAAFVSWRSGARPVGPRPSLAERLALLPRVLPFLAVIAGVVWALYGGIATPSEAAGVGAVLCLLLVVLVYRVRRPHERWPILDSTLKESVMILMIIATSILFGCMLSSLYVIQSIAEWIGGLGPGRWTLLFWINLLPLVAGCFLPPAAIILMTTPIILPVPTEASFDPVRFGVVLTLNLELGLITPPLGLNLFVINGIAPTVALPTILKGALPFVLLMVLQIVILCLFPGLAIWLPDLLMGPRLG